MTLVAVLAVSTPARADKRRTLHLSLTAAGGAVYFTAEALKSDLAPKQCRWCSPPDFDAKMRELLVWHDTQRAATMSDVTGFFVAPAFAIGMSALGARDDGWDGVLDDTLPILESISLSEVALQVVKFSAGRQRPFVHYGSPAPDPDDNLSFFSAHATLGFACATSAGMIAHRRHSPLEPYVWAGGMALAASTSYLRIAADKHYTSDVVIGAAFGVGAGYFIPQWSGGEHELAVVPTGKGMALAGRF